MRTIKSETDTAKLAALRIALSTPTANAMARVAGSARTSSGRKSRARWAVQARETR